MAPLDISPPGMWRVLDRRREEQTGAGRLWEVLGALGVIAPRDVEGLGQGAGGAGGGGVLGALRIIAPRDVKGLGQKAEGAG